MTQPIEQMTVQQIQEEIDRVGKFVSAGCDCLCCDPGPYERASDREKELYEELHRRNVVAPRLAQMLRFGPGS